MKWRTWVVLSSFTIDILFFKKTVWSYGVRNGRVASFFIVLYYLFLLFIYFIERANQESNLKTDFLSCYFHCYIYYFFIL